MNTKMITVKLIFNIMFFVVIISAIYLWILPTYFNGYKTYFFIVAGAASSALVAAYLCYKSIDAVLNTTTRILISSFCGILIGIIVVFITLLIFVNTKGS